ncbi:hypothetical protein [Umezakia ovalisporum]|uniref:Uncharacterized protein n=5 Tax=Umezakia ovalisporum TaxID=75695 RepID=A0ABT6JZ18_9CYAN|nr:hypothetical protein [Umezakia ovalisporum]MDH6055282.1 hypothetical protein [Umezakia ovalisporum FSS-43]
MEQARLILQDVNNVRAESQNILLTTENYLQQSQQIQQENLAIYAANATSINEAISQIDTYNQNIEAQLSQKLQAVESFSNLFDELTKAQRELEEINVTSLVEQARLILQDVNNVRAESQNILLTTENYLHQSQQIQQENLAIYAAIDRYNENIDNATTILTQLESIKSEIDSIGGLEEVRNLLQQVDNTRADLRNSNAQLSFLQGEIREIQYLENYLQDFGRVRNHKQLRQFLTQELGFIGLIVYVLHLLTPNRKR